MLRYSCTGVGISVYTLICSGTILSYDLDDFNLIVLYYTVAHYKIYRVKLLMNMVRCKMEDKQILTYVLSDRLHKSFVWLIVNLYF